MTGLRRNTRQSLVKFMVTFVSVCFLTANYNFAQANDSASGNGNADNRRNNSAPDTGGRRSSDPYAICLEIAGNNAAEKQECHNRHTCSARRGEAREAKDKIYDACKEAGMDMSTCLQDTMDCDETMGSESFSTTATLMGALGLPVAGSGAEAIGGKCVIMSGKDYFSSKKEIEDRIKDINDELADLEKDAADITEDFNKTMEASAKENREAQEDLEDTKLKINEKKRENMQNFSEQQAQIQKDLRSKSVDILKLRGELIKLDRELATQLISLSEAAAKRSCMSSVRKMREEIMKSQGVASSFKSARARKNDLNSTFSDCMASFDQQRTSIMEAHRQQQKMLTQNIADLQSDIDDAENQLKLASNQLAEMEADAKKQEETATQSLVKKLQEAQNKLIAANQVKEQRLKAIAEKQAKLKMELNKQNSELLSLGAQPKKRSSDKAPTEALREIDKYASLYVDFCEDPICAASGGGICPPKSSGSGKRKTDVELLKGRGRR